VWADLRRRQTLASFDYQWRELAEGEAMLSESWMRDQAGAIVADELLGIDQGWFAGRSALDAGCGGGRWTLGLLRLGCRVTAVDASGGAVAATAEQMRRLAPEAVAAGRLEAFPADLLDPPAELAGRRFDLVFSFGVLHHTGDTRRALANVAALVAPDGVLFVYLYGRRSVPPGHRLALAVARSALAPLPFRLKRRLLASLFPGRDTHQAFDLFSPLVNDRYRHETVEAWLRELGFHEVARTLDHTELFLRASRRACSARPFRPPAGRPFWFERHRRPA
jgi:SAM-dependent methyltransferase